MTEKTKIEGKPKKKSTMVVYNNPVAASSNKSPSLRNFKTPLVSGRTALQQYTRDVVNARCKYLANNDTIAGAIIGRFCDYVIADGLKPKPKINFEKAGISKEYAEQLEKRFVDDWETWAESDESHYLGEICFDESQYEQYRVSLISGEIFFTMPHVDEETEEIDSTLRHQSIDPDRVSNEHDSIDTEFRIGGFDFDEDGKAYAVWITRKHPTDITDIQGATDWEQYDIFDENGKRVIFHKIRTRRDLDDVRAIGMLARAMERIFDAHEYRTSEMVAAKKQAQLNFGWFSDEEGNPFDNVEKDPNLEDNEMGLYSNTMFIGDSDARIELLQMTRPNSPHYVPFVQDLKKEIAACEGIPHQIVEMLFDVSFSASKGAINQWRFKVELERKKFARNYCKPHWQRFIDEGVAVGRYKIPNYKDKKVRNEITKCIWEGRKIKEIDEARQASAMKTRLDTTVTSIEHERNEQGVDDEIIEKQVDREFLKKRDRKKTINETSDK